MERKAPVLGKEELEEFRQKTKDFYEGKITKNDYKGYSGRYGSYAQRGGKCSMIRLRMAGGRLTKDKLLYIAQSIEKYHVKKAHLYHLPDHPASRPGRGPVCGIMEGAMEHGIITLGGGRFSAECYGSASVWNPERAGVPTCFPMPRRRKNFSCPSWTRRRCQES